MSTSNSLKTYYDREWQRFESDAKEFAQTYPEQAGHLHLDSPFGRDPDIDHLLQGCTYLSAQIHKRIDEDAHALPAQLAMQLWPEMLQCVPSMSIAVFQLKSLMAQSQLLPAKTALLSKPVGDELTVCRFETIAPITVYPFDIDKIYTSNDMCALTLTLVSTFDRPVSLSHIEELPFCLSDGYAKACELYYYITHCKKIRLTLHGDSVDYPMSIESKKNIRKTGLMAHQILFDYLSFYQQYLFFNVSGFESIKNESESTSFDITFIFEKPLPEDYRVDLTSIQMNACLIVNKFSTDCEPIVYDHSKYRYPILLDRGDAVSTHILDLVSVKGIGTANGKLTEYSPLHQCDDVSRPSYTLSREVQYDEKVNFYLSCFSVNPVREIVSVTASVCNGFYPKRFITKNGLSLSGAGITNICSATNILVPSKMLIPPTEVLSQSFVRYFTLNLSSLLHIDVLKSLLHSLNWASDLQHRRRIDGLLCISAVLKSEISRGAFFHVYEIHLQVHHAHFLSSADIYFFGNVLHQFFSAQALMSQMISMKIITYPNEEVFIWKPMFGQKNVV